MSNLIYLDNFFELKRWNLNWEHKRKRIALQMIYNLGQLKHMSFRVSVGNVGNGQHLCTIPSAVGNQGYEASVPLTGVRIVCPPQSLALFDLKYNLDDK